MSYYAVFDDETGGDVATGTGWGDFRRWVDDLDLEVDEIRHLTEYGWSQELGDLAAQLSDAIDASGTEDVLDIAKGLLDMIRAAKSETIVVTDGCGVEGDEKIEASNTAHRTLLADALGRIARRTVRHANDLAKNPDRLWPWVDNPQDERKAFAEIVSPSLAACLAHLNRSETTADACAVLSGRFFAGLSSAFRISANEGEAFPDTVARLTADFERTIPDQLTTFFFEGNP